MCGLAGVFSFGAQAPVVDRAELARINQHMLRRGPDGEGFWYSDDGRVGLSHRRLSIIDLSAAGSQPMKDVDTGNQIVFNGEIYNFQVLRAEMVAAGSVFRSNSDTEVLLKMYARYGRDMLTRLRGMFAFAIWDQARQGILLARDPFGIKPLYLAGSGGVLRFASQVKALLAGGAIKTTPEPAGHVGFHLWGSVPEPYTLYREIRSLPAGSSLWVDRRGPQRHQRYFSIARELADAATGGAPMSVEQAREELSTAMRDSVRSHLIADVPVGTFLSAGLDSATLVALASRERQSSLNTLTLGFREYAGTLADEVPLAEKIAARYGARQHTRWIGQAEFAAAFSTMIDAMDQPTLDGVNTFLVSQQAHAVGLKVSLSGLGGDELFAGYADFQDIPRMVRLAGAVPAGATIGRGFRWLSAPLMSRLSSPKYAGLLEYGHEVAGAYLLRRGLFMPWELPSVLDPDLVRQGWRDLDSIAQLRLDYEGASDSRRQICALETAWYMRNQLLRDADWASMAHSLEIRVPFVDVPLFRTVARLCRSGHAPSKRDMAGSPESALPAEVLNRPKSGFNVPVRQWLAAGGEAGEAAQRGLRGWARFVHQQF